MPRRLPMTPERAMRAIDLLRDAVAAIERGELTEGGLLFLVSHAVNPVEPDEDDIAWAQEEAKAIMATEEWKSRNPAKTSDR